MPIRHLFAIALALIACGAAHAPAVLAQTGPGPATKRPATPDLATMPAMAFYDAHGEANACGPGCSEWIAADGKIDIGTADRLRQLLAQLKGARPPIFFHSPGGSVTGSILLGELIRERKLTVSVSHTVPLKCDREPKSKNSCDADIRAGKPIEAKLDLFTAMCNSACVYALAGGGVRLIPPWVTLGIHDVGIDLAAAKIRHPSSRAIAAAERLIRTRLRSYIRRMGIDEGLLTEAFATPFTSIGQLTRDDASRFGLDRREFGETVWQLVDKPQPAIRKMFFVRADNGERRYVNALVNVSCAPRLEGRAIVAVARQRLASDTDAVLGPPAASIRVSGRDVRLVRRTSATLYLWSGQFTLTTLEAAADQAAAVLPGEVLGRQQGPSGDVSLAMTGFPAAYAQLQKVCAEQTAAAQGAQVATGLPPLGVLQSMPDASAIPRLRSNPLGIGATRFLVDEKLGAPTKTLEFCRNRRPCGTIALYGYGASDGEHKIIAAYFGGTDHVQRFAVYVLKDGKVFDEIRNTELSEGQELIPVRDLLAEPNKRDQAGTASSLTFTPPSSRRPE